MKKELSYFSTNPMDPSESPIKIESIIEFLIYDKNGTKYTSNKNKITIFLLFSGVVNLGSGVQVIQQGKKYLIYEDEEEVCCINNYVKVKILDE